MGNPLHEPVALAGAVRAIMGLVVVMGWYNFTDQQIGAIILVTEVVLTPLVRAVVTPNKLAEERVAAGGSPTTPRDT